jgi:hypothetical protein
MACSKQKKMTTASTLVSSETSLGGARSMTSSSSTTGSLASLYRKEIDHFNRCEKFISRNRYVANPAYDMSEHWPVWPKNLYFTATPTSIHDNPIDVAREDSSDSFDSFNGDYDQDEPHRKRLRCSPIPPLQSIDPASVPAPDRDLSDWDCELLFHFGDLTDDDQFLISAASLFSDSPHPNY